jgi:hypothetical protein
MAAALSQDARLKEYWQRGYWAPYPLQEDSSPEGSLREIRASS